jgi:hypothetical protein
VCRRRGARDGRLRFGGQSGQYQRTRRSRDEGHASSHPILCPTALPRPWIGFPPGRPPPTHLRTQLLQLGGKPFGVDLAYGAPIEPASGSPGWVKRHIWLNRPCCTLHFDVLRVPPSLSALPSGTRPATLGGRCGLLLDAVGYAFGRRSGVYWPNHTWFFWRQNGVRYAASVHYFGRQATRSLLGQIIRTLKPMR